MFLEFLVSNKAITPHVDYLNMPNRKVKRGDQKYRV